MKNLLLVGAPGSGKGTQSQKLKEMGYIHLSMGDLLRLEESSGSQLGQDIKSFTSKGNFISDELAVKLFKEAVKSNNSYIFDGFPRTVNQAKSFVNSFSDVKVIFFNVSLSDLKERLIYRRTCLDCGMIYNLKTNPPTKDGFCNCGSSKCLFQRDDDKEEFISVRWKNFEDKTLPLLEVLKNANFEMCEIDATQSEDLIFSQVLEFIKK